MKRFLAIFLSLLLLFTCACASDGATATPTPADTQLTVYYIDVGQADAALVVYNDYTMLIDGGNVADGPDVVSFIKSLGITKLDVVIATHAHEDHSGGLANVLSNIGAENVYAPVSQYSSTCYTQFMEEAAKTRFAIAKQGLSWEENGLKAQVLWPIRPEDEDTNNTSIVLKLTLNKISFLFTGDIEHDAETRLVETGQDLSCNVLKAPHHGSDTSSSYLFLRSALPQIAVISVGKDNSYGHPSNEVLDRYLQAEIKTYRTDLEGTVKIVTDGNTISVSGNTGQSTVEGETATPGITATEYIGNINSKKFHLSTCKSLPSEENRIAFSSRQAAVDAGYSPCGSCKP